MDGYCRLDQMWNWLRHFGVQLQSDDGADKCAAVAAGRNDTYVIMSQGYMEGHRTALEPYVPNVLR
jgi:hypothetical protein